MQAVNWKQINDNIVNVGQVLASLVDTETQQNVEFVLIDDNGNVKNVKVGNLAVHLAEIKKNAVSETTVEKIISDKSVKKEDMEKYVNDNITKVSDEIKNVQGDTNKLKDLLSKVYNKDDVDNIINGLKNAVEVRIKEVESSLNIIVIKDEATLEVNRRYAAESSDKSYTVKLPAEPKDGDTIYLMDGSYNAQNNPITVDRNGKQINGKEDNLICDVNGFYVVMRYDNGKGSWFMANVVTK